MNEELVACFKRKNKHLSQEIGKRFKKAHRRHRTKSKNYKKQKSRRNCFIRQDGQNYIKYFDLDYMSKDNIVMVQNYFDHEDNDDVSKGLPIKTKQTRNAEEAKCQVKLVFVCDQHKSKNKWTNLEETHYTIQRKSLKLEMSNCESNINVAFDNDFSAREWWQVEDENDDDNQGDHDEYNEDRDNQMVYLLYYDYYYDCRRLFKDNTKWKNRFDTYSQEYEKFGWAGLPSMNDFSEDLVGYLLSMYLQKGYNYYDLKMKNDLFDHNYNVCSYDINDINDAIVNWFDKLNVELNNNNCLSNNLYSMIILQYLFEPLSEKNSNNSNNNNNSHSNSHLDFVLQEYKNKSYIELNAHCLISNQLWCKIMLHNNKELHDASQNDYQYIFQNDYAKNNVEINICKNKFEKYSFSHLYLIRKLFLQTDWLEILQQFRIRYLG